MYLTYIKSIRHSRIEKAGETSWLHLGGMVSATKPSWVMVDLCNKTFYVVVFQTKERHGVIFEICHVSKLMRQ